MSLFPRLMATTTVSAGAPSATVVTFGFATDLHHNPDKTQYVGSNGTRYHADAEEKLGDAVSDWNSASVDFVVFNGDYIDNVGESYAAAAADLATIEDVYDDLTMDRYYVFGNHDMDEMSKAEFISNSGMTAAYYYFDVNGTRFVVLDACYRSDDDDDHYDAGNFTYDVSYVPPTQRSWLTATLSSAPNDCIVFCHQRLSGVGSAGYQVSNGAAVRTILEGAGNVVAVINGHEHVNGSDTVNGITYYEMEAMCDGAYPTNSYAVFTYYPTFETLVIDGYGNQTSYGEHPVAHTGVSISTPAIVESFPTGFPFATLAGTGGNVDATFAEISDPDSKFEIVNGNQVQLSAALDYATDTTHSLGIRLTNTDASTVDETITISVIEDDTEMALISVTTISNEAQADIALPSGYEKYKISGWLRPANDGSYVKLQTSSDTGSSFDSGASDYSWVNEATSDQADTFYRLHPYSNGNGAAERGEFVLDIFPADGSAEYMAFVGQFLRVDTSGNIDNHETMGRRNSSTVMDYLRFFFDSGNIAAGKIILEGVPTP